MKRALVSVSDKNNLVPFVKKLVEHDFEIVSTGGMMRPLVKGWASETLPRS